MNHIWHWIDQTIPVQSVLLEQDNIFHNNEIYVINPCEHNNISYTSISIIIFHWYTKFYQSNFGVHRVWMYINIEISLRSIYDIDLIKSGLELQFQLSLINIIIISTDRYNTL